MSVKMVRYNEHAVPSPTAAELARFAFEMAKPDSEIDTSDIPEWTDEQFKNAVRGKFYRPVKTQVTAMIDMDVLAWLKSEGKGYQTRMNAILRREMLLALEAAALQKAG